MHACAGLFLCASCYILAYMSVFIGKSKTIAPNHALQRDSADLLQYLFLSCLCTQVLICSLSIVKIILLMSLCLFNLEILEHLKKS